MAVLGDRSIASLLSALAEAPDFTAAATYLLAELMELTGSPRACMLRAESGDESLTLVASSGFSPELPAISISLGDLSNPLVISARSLTPARGHGGLGATGLNELRSWTVLPMSQPGLRGPASVMSA